MGLMDKVKAQANQIAQKTQEAAQEGKAKIDQAQANRRGDAMLRQLGAAVFQDRTGRGTAETQGKIDKLITDLSAHERDNGLNLADPPAVPTQQGSPSGQSGSPGGQPGSPGGQPGGAPQSDPFGNQGQAPAPDQGTGSFGSGQSFFPKPDDGTPPG